MKVWLRCLGLLLLLVGGGAQAAGTTILPGDAQPQRYLPLLAGKRVGLVVNQTSMVGNTHLIDYLRHKQINIAFIFAPEHGYRGNHDAGARVANSVDAATGIPVVSIYGKHKKPSPAILKKLDVIVFDIQDVGVRFYTYLSSMHYMMEAAADSGKTFIVLDRPNPNGRYVDGPILEPAFRSFVGMHPIPVLHGMTLGELARMIKGEHWLHSAKPLDLKVIPVANYRRDMVWSLPVKPSPNLPDDQAIQLYPSLCFFEPTPVSIGRGTPFPFQVIGYNTVHIGQFQFTPKSMPGSALHPKLQDVLATGQDLRKSTIHGLDLTPLVNWYRAFAKQGKVFFTRPGFMDKLAGTDKLRKAIQAGQSAAQIERSWQPGLQAFRTERKPYLLYPDFPSDK